MLNRIIGSDSVQSSFSFLYGVAQLNVCILVFLCVNAQTQYSPEDYTLKLHSPPLPKIVDLLSTLHLSSYIRIDADAPHLNKQINFQFTNQHQ